MILNISGRTDIIAFYTEWFINRLNEGYVDVRNPFYEKMVSRIYFEDVDLFMFCTKNPMPIIPYLSKIKKPILFHITLTPYHHEIEVNVKNKREILSSIKKISKIIGIENVYVRYDPIFLSQKYTIEYHIKAFEKICQELDGYIEHIIISFIDYYKNVKKNLPIFKIIPFEKTDYKRIGIAFSKIAKSHNITVQTCFEEENLVEYGFIKHDCLSLELAYKLTGKSNFKKWTARREKKCQCVEMVDIGAYNSCGHLCRYCYANYDEKKVFLNMRQHDPKSSLLIGHLEEDDKIKVRK